MFDLKFHKLVNDTTSSLNIKSPTRIMVKNELFNEKDTKTSKRLLKKGGVIRSRTDTDVIDDYYRDFIMKYAIPHTNYFLK